MSYDVYTLEDSTTSLDLDDYAVNFETGLPQGDYALQNTIGHGGIVTGINLLRGRKVSISRVFIKNKETERQEWMDWFTRPSYNDYFLRRTSTEFNGLMRVYPALAGGESYNVRDFAFSQEVQFNMIAADPFFYSTSASSTSQTLTSTSAESITTVLNGAFNFCSFKFTSTENATRFKVVNSDNFGFDFNGYTIEAGSTIEVTTTGADLKAFIDGVEIAGFFATGSNPFYLNSSSNDLTVTAAPGTFTIEYEERQL